MVSTEIERLARHLVTMRRTADMAINPECIPYPMWDEASEEYREGARQEAAKILGGDAHDSL